jgi:uncharacterized protein (TIGR02270 family)
MEAALADPDPAIRARTCRTAGELGSVGLHQTVRKSLKVDSEACRFWAAWTTALIVGDSDGLASLRAFAESPDDSYAARALQVAMRRMEPVLAKAWQREMVRNPGLHRRSIIAAGIIGDPEVVPWLTEQMKVPALSRVAGEAFSMITGAHLDHDKLEGQQPEGFESGPTEDPEDENVAMDLDENLAWPDPDLVAKWWDKNKGRFAVGTRYLAGRTMTIELLQQVLREGYQRQRAAAALELAIRQPGQPLFEVRAPGFRQQKLLGLK